MFGKPLVLLDLFNVVRVLYLWLEAFSINKYDL